MQQRHATLEGQGSAALLRECKGGWAEGRKSARAAAAQAGVTGASFLTLPLHEIGFGDIRIKHSVALLLPPPLIAKPAIMPSVSNHFSIKIPTVPFPLPSAESSPLFSLPQHPSLSLPLLLPLTEAR